MKEEVLLIRKLTKVFFDDTGRYWLDVKKYISLASKYDFNSNRLRTQIELIEEDENKSVISEKTISRLRDYIFGEFEFIGDKNVTINTIKVLGKALCDGDEYGLLIKINHKNMLQLINEAEMVYGTNDIKIIYNLINSILYELESSSYYSYKPGDIETDGFDYYDMILKGSDA